MSTTLTSCYITHTVEMDAGIRITTHGEGSSDEFMSDGLLCGVSSLVVMLVRGTSASEPRRDGSCQDQTEDIDAPSSAIRPQAPSSAIQLKRLHAQHVVMDGNRLMLQKFQKGVLCMATLPVLSLSLSLCMCVCVCVCCIQCKQHNTFGHPQSHGWRTMSSTNKHNKLPCSATVLTSQCAVRFAMLRRARTLSHKQITILPQTPQTQPSAPPGCPQ